MSEQSFQELFFVTLRKRYGSEKTITKVMDVLSISKAAAYKRMSGKTALSANELAILTKHFRVSLDTIMKNPSSVAFFHPFMKERSGLSFLDGFHYYLKPTKYDERSELTYLANELPVFYYLSYDYIFNFLMTVWNHLHWSEHQLNIDKNNRVDPTLTTLSKDIANYYHTQPVTEIWNPGMLTNLYQQILFSISIRAFADVAYIDHLVKDISRLIRDLKKVAATGERTQQLEVVPSQIYLNEFGNYLNMVSFNAPRIQATFVGYDIPHFIVTHDWAFYQFSKNWINKLQNHSVLISGDGYQYRESFFGRIEEEFRRFRKQVKQVVESNY